jgi:hypothetical protein
MRDYLVIGSSPCEEDCVQTGSENYSARQKKECRLYIEAIRKKLGKEPQGASLKLKSFLHDFGAYQEVVCYFDTELPESEEYAFKCEGESPATWSEVGMTAPI